MTEYLRTERLVLRRLTPDDVDLLVAREEWQDRREAGGVQRLRAGQELRLYFAPTCR